MLRFGQEYKELFARIEDLLLSAENGSLAYTKFLTPAEALCVKKILPQKGIEKRACFLGGYTGAERVRLVILPSYLDGYDENAPELLAQYFPEEADSLVRAVKITGSGYKILSHRDYLGSILGLGVERDAVGDIVVHDTREAYAFVSDSIAALMLDSLEYVGSDKVKLCLASIDPSHVFEREFVRINDTVASSRFDCVVSSLTRLSRDKAKSLIDSGMCQHNYIEETRLDIKVAPEDIITVRGHGKFIIRELTDKTKKGRLRLIADKHV